MDKSNQKPAPARLVLRVGVTGHRRDNLQNMNSQILIQRLSTVFQLLKSAMDEVQEQCSGSYASDRYLIRIISPLADGSDRIVAEQAVLNGFELQAPLPFYREERESNFSSSENGGKDKQKESLLDVSSAVIELDGSLQNKEHAYEAAGRMVLRQSDVLIAIWDNQEARGAGGTAQIVEEGGRIGLPIIWIYSENDHPVSLLLPENGSIKTEAPEHLAAVLKEKLLPPKHGHEHTEDGHHHEEPDLREAYFQENIRKLHGGFLWRWFKKIVLIGRRRPKKSAIRENGIDSWKDLNPDARENLKRAINKIDAETGLHYRWADHLASYYSDLYHSGFTANYLMSSIAVLFAFITFSLHIHITGYAELAVILGIYLIYRSDKKHMWYHRRIDYRLLAEILRQTRFLAAIGRYAPVVSPQPIHSHYGDPSGSWVHWHYRAIIRQLGMVTSRFEADYLKGVGRLIKKEAQEQAEYHGRKAVENFTMNHRLHTAAVVCFLIAASGCILHIGLEISDPPGFYQIHKKLIQLIVSGLSIVSPAFGAAFAAIKSQGEFERVARHSEAMSEYLKEASVELDAYLSGNQVQSAELARISDDIAEKMIEEVLDWRIVFHKRPIELA